MLFSSFQAIRWISLCFSFDILFKRQEKKTRKRVLKKNDGNGREQRIGIATLARKELLTFEV